jgi:hypothetical protein
MVFSALNHLDLWAEELTENEVEVPLYLIQLNKEDALTTWLLENHDKHATTYFQSPYEIEDLQTYYSRYTFPYVEMESNGYDDEIPRGIFGFYDPKVLPDFIQSLYTQEKQEAFFAGIAVCFSPDVEDVKRCHAYYLKQEGVAYRDLDMHKKSRALNVKAFQEETLPYLSSEEIPTLDEKQIEIFERLNHERFVKEVLQEIETSLSDKEIEKLLPSILEKSYYAKEHLGIDSQANMARFVQVSTQLPKPIEYYAQSTEFKALKSVTEQSEKREILHTLMQKLNLKEVA